MRSAPTSAGLPPPSGSCRDRATVALGRRTVLAGCAAFVILSAWSAASAWYLVARDEVALSLLASQSAQKRAYEDKIAALRARLDEVSTQRMVEQEVLEAGLRDLLARQAAFEARQGRVELLENRVGGPATDQDRDEPAGKLTGGPASRSSRPFPVPRDPDSAGERRSHLDRLRSGLEGAGRTLAALESAQRETLATIAGRARALAHRYEAAIRRVGLNPALDARSAGIGGPLLPADDQGPADPALQEAEANLARLDGLLRRAGALPFAEPIQGEVDVSSGFGHRLDPFTRAPAMHAGLDFRAEHGAPARATGAGRVVVAEYSGAYGNMVEIEHLQGVTSRYAHLSSIAVSVGQEVKPGAVLGRVGSTGRSTGPHLHYETRVNGDAVDPQIFLRAGSALAPVVLATR